MTRVHVEQRFEVAPERVWTALTDFARMPEWFFGVRRMIVTPPEAGLGARRELTLAYGQKHLERLTRWEPPRAFALDVLDPPLFARSFSAEILVEPIAGAVPSSSRVAWAMEFDVRFGAIGRAAVRLAILPVLRFALRRSLAELDSRLERASS